MKRKREGGRREERRKEGREKRRKEERVGKEEGVGIKGKEKRKLSISQVTNLPLTACFPVQPFKKLSEKEMKGSGPGHGFRGKRDWIASCVFRKP